MERARNEAEMVNGDGLKAIREMKDMSQGDIEKRTGLLRCYISRVENGHTVPSLETMEKMARALEIPLYQLFHEGEDKPKPLDLPHANVPKLTSRDSKIVVKIAGMIARMDRRNKALLLSMAKKLAAAGH